jgi:hypothetical protein
MADTPTETLTEPPPRGFPFVTVVATLVALFAFLGLMVLAYHSPNYLDETRDETTTEPKVDPATKLSESRAKNQAVLDGNPGTGAKTSVSEATAQLLGTLRSEKDRLPFPTPPVPEPKVK